MKKVSYIEDFEQWKSEFTFYIPVNIRFSETDMFGHVNNVSPFIYFEEARTSLMKELKLFGELDQTIELVPVVSDLQCDYIKQMYFGQQVKAYCKIQQFGKTSMDIHYLIVDEKGDVCVTGRGRIVQIHAKTGKPTPFTEDQIKILNQIRD